MSRRIDPEDLIDSQGVAEILGLSQHQSVSTYQRRYSDMPRPIVDIKRSRIRLWLRQDIEEWAADRAKRQ